MTDPMDAIRETFFEECGELLETLEGGILAIEEGGGTQETVDAMFRAVHSIKGGAGAFALDALVAFAHEFETALDALRRDGPLAVADAVPVLLNATDRLGDLVAACRCGQVAETPDTNDLAALSRAAGAPAPAAEAPAFEAVALDFGLFPIDDDPVQPDEVPAVPMEPVWTLTFEPLTELLLSGNEPLFLFRALEVLGSVEIEAETAHLPALSDMDVAQPYLKWQVTLRPTAPDLTETEIEAIFDFAFDLCVITIRCDMHPASSARPVRGRGKAPAPALSLVSGGAPTKATPTPTTIRVDLERVDRLVDLVGELVISQSMLAQGMSRAGLDTHSEAVASLDDLQQLTRDMQDSVMAIRAQPVRSLFQRMSRIVREAAHATGKDVRLVTDGEATEIDKTVVERLAEPLTHMVRNAIDHGIEDRGTRSAAGKAEAGTIRLSARQQSDRVIIEVTDDGAGIDRAKVLMKAVERGLVERDTRLDEAEIDNLLFLPGFSTSQTVSSLSGRGVGMDVVHQAIHELNGTISITSSAGAGCTISISLPLTLAILDGMIVQSNGQRMVVPLAAILETQTASAARVETIGPGCSVVRLQDAFVPLLDLAEGMGFSSRRCGAVPEEEGALLFVQADGTGTFALRVDMIEAQRQVVIKGLGDDFGHVPCVSAATILGDGQVALIVDPVGIATMWGLSKVTNRVPAPEAIAR